SGADDRERTTSGEAMKTLNPHAVQRPRRGATRPSRAALLAGGGAMFFVLLAGCVSRGDWHATAAIAPQNLVATRTLANATVTPAAWPTDSWWSGYGDPQLDTLIDEAFAGSPTLEIAQARLRAAQ